MIKMKSRNGVGNPYSLCFGDSPGFDEIFIQLSVRRMIRAVISQDGGDDDFLVVRTGDGSAEEMIVEWSPSGGWAIAPGYEREVRKTFVHDLLTYINWLDTQDDLERCRLVLSVLKGERNRPSDAMLHICESKIPPRHPAWLYIETN